MPTIQTKDSDGSVVIYGNPACPPKPKSGYTIRQVDAIPSAPGNLVWQGNALVRVVVAVSLNDQLHGLFKSAPIQAQVVFSNILDPLAALISSGQLPQAVAALEGMLADDLVPNKYSALVTQAVALIQAQIPAPPAAPPAA